MGNLELIDWILTAALLAASWQLHHLVEPHHPAPPAGETHPAAASAAKPVAAATPQSLDETLRQIGRAGGFDTLDEFLRGARLAYEAVVTAFAAGDLAPVAGFVGPAVREAFDAAIAERVARQETLSTLFIGFLAAEPVAAGFDGESAWIDVRFVAQLVSTTADRDGRLIAGHPRRIDAVAEIWTFAHAASTADPNWTLIATEADE
jgi:predicted lipid-binding transport protein (Tim44 family)